MYTLHIIDITLYIRVSVQTPRIGASKNLQNLHVSLSHVWKCDGRLVDAISRSRVWPSLQTRVNTLRIPAPIGANSAKGLAGVNNVLKWAQPWFSMHICTKQTKTNRKDHRASFLCHAPSRSMRRASKSGQRCEVDHISKAMDTWKTRFGTVWHILASGTPAAGTFFAVTSRNLLSVSVSLEKEEQKRLEQEEAATNCPVSSQHQASRAREDYGFRPLLLHRGHALTRSRSCNFCKGTRQHAKQL